MARKYVYQSTIKKNVPYSINNPGETIRVKVGAHRLKVTRADRLDRYGNPVYTATVLGRSAPRNASYKTNGHVQHAVQGALWASGVLVRFPKKK